MTRGRGCPALLVVFEQRLSARISAPHTVNVHTAVRPSRLTQLGKTNRGHRRQCTVCTAYAPTRRTSTGMCALRPRIQTPREHSSALAGSTCTQSADSRTGYRSAFHPRDAAPQRKRTSGGSSPHRCDEPPKHGVEFLIYANCVRVTRVTATESHSSVNSAKSCSWHTRPKESREARTAATPPADGARGRGGGDAGRDRPTVGLKDSRMSPSCGTRVGVWFVSIPSHVTYSPVTSAVFYKTHGCAVGFHFCSFPKPPQVCPWPPPSREGPRTPRTCPARGFLWCASASPAHVWVPHSHLQPTRRRHSPSPAARVSHAAETGTRKVVNVK